MEMLSSPSRISRVLSIGTDGFTYVCTSSKVTVGGITEKRAANEEIFLTVQWNAQGLQPKLARLLEIILMVAA